MFSAHAGAVGVPLAALRASRFLKPPGRFKRAEMREHPRKSGPWDGLLKAVVRRREKARQFELLPPPRLVPEALPSSPPSLARVRGVPSVSSEALQLRLQFLLGPKAPAQQQRAKLRPGLTPYQAELFMWERQMRDLRRIYRAQFLQRLAEVTDEEMAKQHALQAQIREDRRIRREETLQRVYDDKRRRAVLKDRLQIERKVTQAVQLGRLSRKKVANLLWLNKLQKGSHYLHLENEAYEDAVAAKAEAGAEGGDPSSVDPLLRQRLRDEARREALRAVEQRNVSVPQILDRLGLSLPSDTILLMRGLRDVAALSVCAKLRVHAGIKQKVEKSPRKIITGTDDVFREILEESFKLLPEDAPSLHPEGGEENRKAAASVLTEEQRAEVTYAHFTDEEKLQLLDEKLEQLNKKIDADSQLRGGTKDALLLQLRDHLQAAKEAYLERSYLKETEERLRQQRALQQDEADENSEMKDNR